MYYIGIANVHYKVDKVDNGRELAGRGEYLSGEGGSSADGWEAVGPNPHPPSRAADSAPHRLTKTLRSGDCSLTERG
jgi:hypothetical protein